MRSSQSACGGKGVSVRKIEDNLKNHTNMEKHANSLIRVDCWFIKYWDMYIFKLIEAWIRQERNF